jgi:hypothetical protein
MTAVMASELLSALAALVAAGDAETLGKHHYVPVFTLDSGARCGLVEDGRWALAEGDNLVLFGDGDERAFVEVVEHRRSDVDERIELGAKALGLSVDQVLFSFPAVELTRALLATRSGHFVRLALEWLLPSELRSLRGEIAAVAADPHFQTSLRDLAQRMVVGER